MLDSTVPSHPTELINTEISSHGGALLLPARGERPLSIALNLNTEDLMNGIAKYRKPVLHKRKHSTSHPYTAIFISGSFQLPETWHLVVQLQ